MSKEHSAELGTEKISKLLWKQAVPAAVGMLVMSIYTVVDTIFVGRYVGAMGIAAITVVMPITFLISSIGMAIGVGGASVISRTLGANHPEKAFLTFGNMISLTTLLAFLLVVGGYFLEDQLLLLFGANGNILPYAKEYFSILLIGVPFLAWAMMSNNTIRAEGEARMAMFTLLIPAIVNIILDPIFIIWLDMGLAGAAWATTISYVMSATYTSWFFLSGRSDLRIHIKNLTLKLAIVKEISAIGFVTLARQGTISLLTIVLNHSLFRYGNESTVAVFGIINRLMFFVNFPVLGLTQGFLPIAGYNYGAKKWSRVRKTIRLAMRAGTAISIGIFLLVISLAHQIVALFTTDAFLLEETPRVLIIIFLAAFLLNIQLIGSAYFQAIGKAIPALLLTLTKQGFLLIPLILTLPLHWGLDGIWFAFPIADVLATIIIYWYLQRELKQSLPT